MFTGLVKSIGKIRAKNRVRSGLTIEVEYPLDANLAFNTGDSVAIDGCCLTVEKSERNLLTVFAVSETLSRTTLPALRVGDGVNLEGALRAGDAIGGHIVQGHVDAVGIIRRLVPKGGGWMFAVAFPPKFAQFLTPEGSVAVDGISFTVKRVAGNVFEVAIIPETMKRTALGKKHVGDRVNLEFDILAKYAQNRQTENPANKGLESLRDALR